MDFYQYTKLKRQNQLILEKLEAIEKLLKPESETLELI